MNLKISDIIGVGIASLLLFPVVFFAVLLGTGTAHLEFGEDSAVRAKLAGYLEKMNPMQRQNDLEQSKLFEANKKKASEMEAEQARLQEEISRLETLKAENARLKESISSDRKHIEDMVGQSKQLSDQRVDELAQVYGAMKPVEAAPILLNMDDLSIAKIIKRVPETRSQAKLMAALGAMDSQRAASITQILGWKKQGL
ncbi:MAG TPA: hypothetical protein VLM37_02555 [Fibrobacteraceae bacterium]|nr:hypothetical protein [Fibrobacteraceae bacterium]